MGKSLVSLQAALCIVLVVGAALFATTLQELRSFNPGFKRDRVLIMNLFPQPGAEKIPNRTAYYHELVEKLATIPGVTGVSYSNNGPLSLELRRTVSSSSGNRVHGEIQH